MTSKIKSSVVLIVDFHNQKVSDCIRVLFFQNCFTPLIFKSLTHVSFHMIVGNEMTDPITISMRPNEDSSWFLLLQDCFSKLLNSEF